MSIDKANTYVALLRRSRTVKTYVRVAECRGLPEHFSEQSVIRLDFGYAMPIPIRGLNVDSYGIGGFLRFGTADYLVVIPWGALVGCRIDDGTEHMLMGASPSAPAPEAPTPSAPNVVRVDFKARRVLS